MKKDTLEKINEGLYRKIISDTMTKQQLMELIKQKTPEVYLQIKDSKSKPVSSTNIQIKPTEKKTEVSIHAKDSIVELVSKYPDNKDPFIKHTLNVVKHVDKYSIQNAKWEFSELPIDLVVTEERNGIYKTYINGPEWLQVTNVKVNSLPIKTTKQNNFGVIVGGGLGYQINTQKTFMSANVGIRYKTSYFLGGLQTNKYVTLSYLKEF